jgi:hypothetical protein
VDAAFVAQDRDSGVLLKAPAPFARVLGVFLVRTTFSRELPRLMQLTQVLLLRGAVVLVLVLVLVFHCSSRCLTP